MGDAFKKVKGGEPLAIPAAADHIGNFVILLEPAAGEIGRACISGVCPVRVDVNDEDDQFADVKDGEATMLESAPTGSARIIWKESGTGTKWAVVRLGGGAGLPPGTTDGQVLWWWQTAATPGWSVSKENSPDNNDVLTWDSSEYTWKPGPLRCKA